MIVEKPLSYENRLDCRDPGLVDMVVIHCTELPDLETARLYGEKIHHPGSRTGNCGHFYVDRDGRIEQWVAVNRVAHHVRGLNENSIGIELVNLGRYPDWLDSRTQEMIEPYPQAQTAALIALLLHLQQQLVGLRHMAGHEDLDTESVISSNDPDTRVQRKRDPGEQFPWSLILEAVKLERIKA